MLGLVGFLTNLAYRMGLLDLPFSADQTFYLSLGLLAIAAGLTLMAYTKASKEEEKELHRYHAQQRERRLQEHRHPQPLVRAARPAAPPWGPHSAQPRPTGRPAPLRATAAAEALPLPEGTLEYPRSAPGAIYADTKIRLTNATVLKLRTSVATYDEVA